MRNDIQPTFTLCFIRNQDKFLMLHRNKHPNKGKWNGVGGKIEQGETPSQACLREVKEETGILLTSVTFRGIVYWNNEGGMYVYLAETTQKDVTSSYEGKLEWKSLEWILSSSEVVSNIPLFLKPMLDLNLPPQVHSFIYTQEGDIKQHHIKELEIVPDF